MVAFTSPSFGWLDLMRKDFVAHCTLFMPAWELGELWDAVQLLQLDLSFEELIKRHQQFGGVPRYYLQAERFLFQLALLWFLFLSSAIVFKLNLMIISKDWTS
jgi:hypothetical protein